MSVGITRLQSLHAVRIHWGLRICHGWCAIADHGVPARGLRRRLRKTGRRHPIAPARGRRRLLGMTVGIHRRLLAISLMLLLLGSRREWRLGRGVVVTRSELEVV